MSQHPLKSALFCLLHVVLYYMQPELQYNIALCYYKTKQYGESLRYLAEIIERGVREHPELSVGR
jgi:hypothetical protein